MKLPEFDMTKAMWDRYSRFYVTYPGANDSYSPTFVHFSTGELIVRNVFDGYPDRRTRYGNLGLIVANTNDSHCPTLWSPHTGERIKKSWFADTQTLVCDDETDRAVVVAFPTRVWDNGQKTYTSGKNAWNEIVPKDLRGEAAAYFSGAGEVPVGNPLVYEKPKVLSIDEKQHCNDMAAQARAWYTMTDQKDKLYDVFDPVESDMLIAMPSFAAITDLMRCRLVRRNYTISKLRITVPYALLSDPNTPKD